MKQPAESLPSTRSEAKAAGSARYFTGRACRHGHISERLASNGMCADCLDTWNKKSVANGSEARRRSKNYERDPQRFRDAQARYYRRNKDLYAERCSNRRALTTKVKWADLRKIRDIYRTSRLISAVTGIQFHVDHIIPLRHKSVCGLHVEANLQILPATTNQQKKNTWSDE
jgi:hypothetical protein